MSEPRPCKWCRNLVARDKDEALHATNPAITEPWTCKESPTGQHELDEVDPLAAVPDRQLEREIWRREQVRREVEHRRKVQEAERERARRYEQDVEFAKQYGLTFAQLEEIMSWLADNERMGWL